MEAGAWCSESHITVVSDPFWFVIHFIDTAGSVHTRRVARTWATPHPGRPLPDRPKFRSFLPVPATIFILSSLSWGSFR